MPPHEVTIIANFHFSLSAVHENTPVNCPVQLQAVVSQRSAILTVAFSYARYPSGTRS
jgi:hypothetical protein